MSGFFSDITGGSLLGGALGFAGSAIQNSFNKRMMREQMAYNTKEREASQAFQTSEREAQQAYQTSEREAQNQYTEDTYNKYQSPEALVKQYMDAGLDPRLAMGNGSVGSIAASSGSSGGAPSSGAPSGRSVSPPYQDLGAMTSGFVNISNALKSMAEAKKAGIDARFLEQTFGPRVKKVMNDLKLQDLEIDYSRLNNKKAEKALDLITAEIAKENANVDLINANLKILEKEGVIAGYRADTFMENFRNEQNHKIAETNMFKERAETEKTQQGLNKSQTTLTDLMHATEKTKPALNRAYTKLADYQGEAARVASEIAEATKVSEVKAIRDKNNTLIEKITAEIKALNAQAELAMRNKDYSTWDKINDSVGVLGNLGMLFLIGKNAFKAAAPLLSAPIPAFTPQYNFSDPYAPNQNPEIWY